MWVTKTPRELMWGYDEELFDIANEFGLANIPPNGKFGYFTKVSIAISEDNECFSIIAKLEVIGIIFFSFVFLFCRKIAAQTGQNIQYLQVRGTHTT